MHILVQGCLATLVTRVMDQKAAAAAPACLVLQGGSHLLLLACRRAEAEHE